MYIIYRCTKKSHATIFPKRFIPLYLEDLKFLIKRCCWRVTQIYSHYTFEQTCFKRGFVLMNQKSRQNAKNAIKKNLFKLMNNTNFGYIYGNNANNPKFDPTIHEVNEITYIKKYCKLFGSKISNFVNNGILEQEVEPNFQRQIPNVIYDDPFRSSKINPIKNDNKEDIDVLESLKKMKENQKRENLQEMLKQNWKMGLKAKR